MIWDRFVRVSHWSLAAGVMGNYWLLDDGGDLHEWLGYGLAALIVARIAWGFVGPKPARFSTFLVSPLRVVHSLRHFGDDYRSHTGHSPLAGYMVVTLFGLVLALSLTGWMQSLDAFWGEEWLQTLHAVLAHSLMIAAGIHVTAVLLIQWHYKIPLIRSMR